MKGNAIEYFLNYLIDDISPSVIGFLIPLGEKINDIGIMLFYFIVPLSPLVICPIVIQKLASEASSVLLAKSSFAFLLLSMFFYWFQATFKIIRQTFFKYVPSLAMWLANITLAAMLTLRWIESGHFPLSNLYESLLFLSWSLTSIHLFLERALNKGVACLLPSVIPKKIQATESTLTLGAITSPLALFTNAFATFSLPEEMQKVTVLVPALQSNWLIMHVSVMMISYAALLSGSLLAMAFLVVTFVIDFGGRQEEEKSNTLKIDLTKGTAHNAITAADRSAGFIDIFSLSAFPQRLTNEQNLTLRELAKIFSPKMSMHQRCKTEGDMPNDTSPLLITEGDSRGVACEAKEMHPQMIASTIDLGQTLDNLSYRSIGLGFAFLTIGIFSGAVWANEAWGSYWSWDPKETWAFVTWLVFALYLHTRISRGWVEKKSAFVATFGFLIIWFCYLGVNIFGKGLHSYGWFSSN